MGRVGGVWQGFARAWSGRGAGLGGRVVEAHSWSSLLRAAVRGWDHVGPCWRSDEEKRLDLMLILRVMAERFLFQGGARAGS